MVSIPGQEDPLGKEMATHSNILSWKILTEKPGGLLCLWDFSGKKYWNRLPFPFPGDLPNPGIKPASPVSSALQADSLPLSYLGSPLSNLGLQFAVPSGSLCS